MVPHFLADRGLRRLLHVQGERPKDALGQRIVKENGLAGVRVACDENLWPPRPDRLQPTGDDAAHHQRWRVLSMSPVPPAKYLVGFSDDRFAPRLILSTYHMTVQH